MFASNPAFDAHHGRFRVPCRTAGSYCDRNTPDADRPGASSAASRHGKRQRAVSLMALFNQYVKTIPGQAWSGGLRVLISGGERADFCQLFGNAGPGVPGLHLLNGWRPD